MICYNSAALQKESKSGDRCFAITRSRWRDLGSEGEESPNTRGQRAR